MTARWHDFLSFSQWAIASGYRVSLEIDRIDGNLDYCPENCRWATRQQQVLNSAPRIPRKKSPFKGVHQHAKGHGSRWRAYVRVLGRTISLGCYDTAEEAARAYDRAAIEHYGIYARPNFPQ